MECKCVTCIKKDCPERTEQDDLEVVFACDDYLDHEPTNADRIRAMSDDELAELICKNRDCTLPEECPGYCACRCGEGKANGLKTWLKQPAEVEHE